MSSYCYAGFDMRTMARVPFSKAEQDARFQLRMDFFFVNFLIKWNFRQAEHLSFITRCVSFVTGFSEVMKRLWILLHSLSHTKKVFFVEFHGKKDIIFLWPNRKRSTEISKAIFLLQNPAVCLYTSHSEKRVKGKSLWPLSAKWRFFVCNCGPWQCLRDLHVPRKCFMNNGWCPPILCDGGEAL